MAVHLKKHWRSWLVAILTVVILLFIAASTSAFQECMNHSYYESADQEPEKGIAQIFRTLGWSKTCTGAFLKEDGEAITAFFTLVLSISTIALWWSTHRLWEAGKEALQVSERAFIFLDGFNIELTLATDSTDIKIERLPEIYKNQPELYITRFAIFPKWKNSGNTPTKNMTIEVNWQGPTGPIPPDYIYKNSAAPFFIAPGATELGQIVTIPSASSLVDFGLRRLGDEPRIFIWGRAEYDDVFGNRHGIEWCRELSFERHREKRMSARFIQWGEYNRSYEKTPA